MLVKAGATDDFAQKLVRFATLIREGYETSVISQPIGPRELLLSFRLVFAAVTFQLVCNAHSSTNSLQRLPRQREIADRIFV
jgi:cobaltochelatase CobS